MVTPEVMEILEDVECKPDPLLKNHQSLLAEAVFTVEEDVAVSRDVHLIINSSFSTIKMTISILIDYAADILIKIHMNKFEFNKRMENFDK